MKARQLHDPADRLGTESVQPQIEDMMSDIDDDASVPADLILDSHRKHRETSSDSARSSSAQVADKDPATAGAPLENREDENPSEPIAVTDQSVELNQTPENSTAPPHRDPSTHAYPSQRPRRPLMKFTYPSNSKPLDGYTIKRGIGIGGFGEVYFALSDAGKEIALKRIQRNLDVELRGVKQCLNLKHVNLIALWDIRTNDFGESWVVMEYVPGPSLRDVLRENPEGLPEDEIKRWFLSTASGVAYLHDQGIVHRDLKPGNIFHDDDQNVIKIGDYGLSKFISCGRRSGQTESVGTFHYMAPEIGKGSYGKEIDVYALGIILYELVTGNVPFSGESSQEIIMKHLTANPNVDQIPNAYRKVVTCALAKDPEVRYNNVPEMLADLPWPEIAQQSQQVLNKNAIGPVAMNTSVRSTSDVSDEIIDAEVANRKTGARLRPMLNGGSDIVFGPLNDTNAGRDPRDESGGVSNPDRPVYGYSQEPRQPAAEVDPIQVLPPRPLPSASTVPGVPAKEDASIVRKQGWLGVVDWWNNANLATPTRVALLLAVGICVLKNSHWLLPVAVLAGLFYLIQFSVQTWQSKLGNTSTEQLDRMAIQARTRRTVREWLGDREWGDRIAELVGSLLVAAISCGVFNLLAMAITGPIFDATLQSWSLFTWLTLSSILACWGLLICSKLWEHREGDRWQRQFLLLFFGVAVGAATYAIGNAFTIDLTTFAQNENNPVFTPLFSVNGLPVLGGYMVFFMVLFGVLRWWLQSDPVRRTRLSIGSVGICLVWATGLSYVLNFAPLWTCVLAAIVAVSVQLAAPWLHPDQRRKICTRSVRP